MKLAATILTSFLFATASIAQQSSLTDPSFSFQKVTFSAASGIAVSDYREIQIDIDSSGSMYFSCLPGKVKKNGTYKGQLTPAQLQKVRELLYNSHPEQYAVSDTHGMLMMDGPSHGFRIWYRYHNKAAMSQGVAPGSPPLEAYMTSLINIVPLVKTSNDFGQVVSEE